MQKILQARKSIREVAMNMAGRNISVSLMSLQNTKFNVTIHHDFLDFNHRKRVERVNWGGVYGIQREV